MKCILCEKEYDKLTEHHLIPKTCHKKIKSKKAFVNIDLSKTINTCESCHKQIHALISEKELAYNYNTVEKLKRHPSINKYIVWAKKRNNIRSIKTKRSW